MEFFFEHSAISVAQDALVAELVDAQDLKSCLPKGECGFDSRLGHESPSTIVEGFLHFRSGRTCSSKRMNAKT